MLSSSFKGHYRGVERLILPPLSAHWHIAPIGDLLSGRCVHDKIPVKEFSELKCTIRTENSSELSKLMICQCGLSKFPLAAPHAFNLVKQFVK